MEPEVKTRSTQVAAKAILEATGRMWKADNTGVYSTDPLLWEWEDDQATDQFAAVTAGAKHWHLFDAPSTDSRFWRLVRSERWLAAPTMPNGTPTEADPWDFAVEPGDGLTEVQEKLEHARDVLLQALADGEFNE